MNARQLAVLLAALLLAGCHRPPPVTTAAAAGRSERERIARDGMLPLIKVAVDLDVFRRVDLDARPPVAYAGDTFTTLPADVQETYLLPVHRYCYGFEPSPAEVVVVKDTKGRDLATYRPR